MYRSGDLGRWRADGAIEYLGRTDHQVKVRGHRIELGEIETVLSTHPTVSQAVVSVREDETGEKHLVGYVVIGAGEDVASQELRQYLKERLPDSMVPNTFVLLDRLPVNANGKVDRKALPRPEGQLRKTPYEPPRTELESSLARIWEQVLRVPRVGILDDFFELGGHSLLATRIVAQMREVLNIDLPLRALFDESTVAALARRCKEMRADAEPQKRVKALVARARKSSRN
jgi:hypothetical protein